MTLNTDAILQDISAQLPTDGKLWVAFSGGLDSTVLLHIVSRAVFRDRVKAVHINHQLSPFADDWENHCVLASHDFGLPCEVYKVEVINTGKGLEQNAREQRYEVFENALNTGDLMLFAHHESDVTETFIFRLMRGAGLVGLTSMPRRRALGSGCLYRPLLNVPKVSLLHYAQEHGLSWVEDESNQDRKFDRNFLRHEVLPALKRRWPLAEEKILKTVGLLEESTSLLDEYLAEDLKVCERRKARFGESISLAKLLSFSPARQRHVLRCWCMEMGFSSADSAHLEKIHEVTLAREDAQPVLAWGDCELRRYDDRLYLVARPDPRAEQEVRERIPVQLNEPLALSDGSELECSGLSDSAVNLSIGFRSGAERCKPVSRNHSQTLKKLLQEYRLEPWLRNRVPLIYLDETLIAVGDLFNCTSEQVLPKEFTVCWRCP